MIDRLPEIATLELNRAETRIAAIQEILAAQEKCRHEKIVETEGWPDSFGWRSGRRICICCGLEEVSRYGWPGTTIDGGLYEFLRPAGQLTILNSEFIKFGDVCKYRVNI